MSTKKPIIIANWKMQLGISESVALAKELKDKVSQEAEAVICPSFISLLEVKEALKKSNIKLGAQDCFMEDAGAFTGEVSANELKEAGCEFVILGHSERREHLQETDNMIHQKVKSALDAGLIPIVCVGETFEQRHERATDYTLIHQTTKALEGIEVGLERRVIIAYEPVWVIGSGQAINPQDTSASHDVIHQTLIDLFPARIVENNFQIIYGGSVNGNNIHSFMSLENIDGVLVGGASLKAEDFLAIIENS